MAIDDVPDLFDGQAPPPRHEDVLAQGFLRDPTYCRDVLPDQRMWPRELDHLPANADGRIRIDRALVFAIAQRVSFDIVVGTS